MTLIPIYISIILLVSSAIFSLMSFAIRIKGYVFNEFFKWCLYIGTFVLLTTLVISFGFFEFAFYVESIDYVMTSRILVTAFFVLFSTWIFIRGNKLRGSEIKIITVLLALNVLFMVYSFQGNVNIWNICFCQV